MDLESSCQKKKIITIMVIDINWIYCGDDFTICTNIESLYFLPETNIMLYQLYINFKNIIMYIMHIQYIYMIYIHIITISNARL